MTTQAFALGAALLILVAVGLYLSIRIKRLRGEPEMTDSEYAEDQDRRAW